MKVGATAVVATGKEDAGATFGEVGGDATRERVEDVVDVELTKEVGEQGGEGGDLGRGYVLVVSEAMMCRRGAELVREDGGLGGISIGHGVLVVGDRIKIANLVRFEGTDIAQCNVDGAMVNLRDAHVFTSAVGCKEAVESAVSVYDERRKCHGVLVCCPKASRPHATSCGENYLVLIGNEGRGVGKGETADNHFLFF